MKKSGYPHFIALALALPAFASGCNMLTPDNPKGGGSSGPSTSSYKAGNLPQSASPNAPLTIGYYSTGTTSLAQSFELSSTSTAAMIASATLQLKAIAPAGQTVNNTLVVNIEPDNSGQPSGQELGTATVNTAAVTTTQFNDYAVTFTPTVTLLPNTTYWLVATMDGSLSSTNYIEWAGGTTGSLPANIKVLSLNVNDGLNWGPPSGLGLESEMFFGIGSSD